MKTIKKISAITCLLLCIVSIQSSSAECTLTMESGTDGQCHFVENHGFYCGEIVNMPNCFRVPEVIIKN